MSCKQKKKELEPCEDDQDKKEPPCEPPPKGPDRQSWNRCVFGSFISISTGVILGSLGTLLMASEMPVVVGTGVGVSLAATLCGKSLKGGNAKHKSGQSGENEDASCDRNLCAEDFDDCEVPTTVPKKKKSCFCGCQEGGGCGIKQTSCKFSCKPPRSHPSEAEDDCLDSAEAKTPKKPICSFDIEVEGYRCSCTCTPIEDDKKNNKEKENEECEPVIPCPT